MTGSASETRHCSECFSRVQISRLSLEFTCAPENNEGRDSQEHEGTLGASLSVRPGPGLAGSSQDTRSEAGGQRQWEGVHGDLPPLFQRTLAPRRELLEDSQLRSECGSVEARHRQTVKPSSPSSWLLNSAYSICTEGVARLQAFTSKTRSVHRTGCLSVGYYAFPSRIGFPNLGTNPVVDNPQVATILLGDIPSGIPEFAGGAGSS